MDGSWQVLPLFSPTLSFPFWFLPGAYVPLRAPEDPWPFVSKIGGYMHISEERSHRFHQVLLLQYYLPSILYSPSLGPGKSVAVQKWNVQNAGEKT